jgi:peptidyl-dipeptidase A
MWGQSWSNALDVTIPYPGKNFLDVTTEMVEQVSELGSGRGLFH